MTWGHQHLGEKIDRIQQRGLILTVLRLPSQNNHGAPQTIRVSSGGIRPQLGICIQNQGVNVREGHTVAASPS